MPWSNPCRGRRKVVLPCVPGDEHSGVAACRTSYHIPGTRICMADTICGSAGCASAGGQGRRKSFHSQDGHTCTACLSLSS